MLSLIPYILVRVRVLKFVFNKTFLIICLLAASSECFQFDKKSKDKSNCALIFSAITYLAQYTNRNVSEIFNRTTTTASS